MPIPRLTASVFFQHLKTSGLRMGNHAGKRDFGAEKGNKVRSEPTPSPSGAHTSCGHLGFPLKPLACYPPSLETSRAENASPAQTKTRIPRPGRQAHHSLTVAGPGAPASHVPFCAVVWGVWEMQESKQEKMQVKTVRIPPATQNESSGFLGSDFPFSTSFHRHWLPCVVRSLWR